MLKMFKIFLAIFLVQGIFSLRVHNKLFLGQEANNTNATTPTNVTGLTNKTVSDSNKTISGNVTEPVEKFLYGNKTEPEKKVNKTLELKTENKTEPEEKKVNKTEPEEKKINETLELKTENKTVPEEKKVNKTEEEKTENKTVPEEKKVNETLELKTENKTEPEKKVNKTEEVKTENKTVPEEKKVNKTEEIKKENKTEPEEKKINETLELKTENKTVPEEKKVNKTEEVKTENKTEFNITALITEGKKVGAISPINTIITTSSPVITIKGEARGTVETNLVKIGILLENKEKTASEALRANKEKLEDLNIYLNGLNVNKDNITDYGFGYEIIEGSDSSNNGDEGKKKKNFELKNNEKSSVYRKLEISVSDKNSVAKILDKLKALEIKILYIESGYREDTISIETNQLIKIAVDDAKSRAESALIDSGLKLAKILNINIDVEKELIVLNKPTGSEDKVDVNKRDKVLVINVKVSVSYSLETSDKKEEEKNNRQ